MTEQEIAADPEMRRLQELHSALVRQRNLLQGEINRIVSLRYARDRELRGPQHQTCRCGHGVDAHGNDGAGACGEKSCRRGGCNHFQHAESDTITERR